VPDLNGLLSLDLIGVHLWLKVETISLFTKEAQFFVYLFAESPTLLEESDPNLQQ
jgi:hypothetical protein